MALLPKDPAKQKQIVAGLVAVLLAFAYYNFLYGPRTAEIALVQEHVDALELSNQISAAVVQQYGADLERRIAIYEEHIDQLEELIPRREDLPILINRVTEQAQANGVELIALNPGVEEPGEFYSHQTYELQVLGAYHDIGQYLASIGSLPRIVRASEMRLSVEAEAEDPADSPLLRAIFRIETYVMPDAAAVSDTTTATPTDATNANG